MCYIRQKNLRIVSCIEEVFDGTSCSDNKDGEMSRTVSIAHFAKVFEK